VRKKSPVAGRVVERIGMAEARVRLPELATRLAKDPDCLVEVTRRGRPVLHLLAPPRVQRQATAARRILQRVAALDRAAKGGKRIDAARRYKALLYGDD
jgi:antitoxin (DNA-binding transcriptional repressor) of toxin-antitoxin stability system